MLWLFLQVSQCFLTFDGPGMAQVSILPVVLTCGARSVVIFSRCGFSLSPRRAARRPLPPDLISEAVSVRAEPGNNSCGQVLVGSHDPTGSEYRRYNGRDCHAT
jgi:hypothetical protein